MKTTRIIMTIALTIFSLAYKAQDKYDFLTISYESFYRDLIVCVDGKPPVGEQIEVEKAERAFLNNTPLLKKVNEYQEQGWEVVTFNTVGFNVTNSTRFVNIAYMRKKKSEKK